MAEGFWKATSCALLAHKVHKRPKDRAELHHLGSVSTCGGALNTSKSSLDTPTKRTPNSYYCRHPFVHQMPWASISFASYAASGIRTVILSPKDGDKQISDLASRLWLKDDTNCLLKQAYDHGIRLLDSNLEIFRTMAALCGGKGRQMRYIEQLIALNFILHLVHYITVVFRSLVAFYRRVSVRIRSLSCRHRKESASLHVNVAARSSAVPTRRFQTCVAINRCVLVDGWKQSTLERA